MIIKVVGNTGKGGLWLTLIRGFLMKAVALVQGLYERRVKQIRTNAKVLEK